MLDTIGSETQQCSFATLPEEGILVSIVSSPSEEAIRSQKVRSHFVITPPNDAQLKEITALMLLSNPSKKNPAAKRDTSSTQDDLKRVYTRQDYMQVEPRKIMPLLRQGAMSSAQPLHVHH